MLGWSGEAPLALEDCEEQPDADDAEPDGDAVAPMEDETGNDDNDDNAGDLCIVIKHTNGTRFHQLCVSYKFELARVSVYAPMCARR